MKVSKPFDSMNTLSEYSTNKLGIQKNNIFIFIWKKDIVVPAGILTWQPSTPYIS